MTEKQNKPAEIKTHILEPVERPSDKRKSRPHVQPKKNGRRQDYPLQKAKHAPIKRFNPRQHKQSLAEKLVKTFTSLISKGVKTILPWTFLSLLVFTIGAYYVFSLCFTGRDYPFWYLLTSAFILFVFYGFFGLFYGMAMGLLYTVKAFSEAFGSLIRESINRIKNSIESKIDNVADTLSRNQAAQVVKQTFDDLAKNIRKYAARTAAGITALAVLGGILFLCRKILIKSLSKIKNKADFFTVMSARATLVAAIILNLTFFAKLAIAAGLMFGALMLGSQALIILLLR